MAILTALTPSIELEKGSIILDVSSDPVSATSSTPDLKFKSVNSAPDIVDCKNDASTQTVLSPEILLPIHEKELSVCRLLGAHFGAALALFLATTDSTIVSTSLPTIVRDLTASQSQYTWVGVSYMLTQTAGQPLYGKLSDILGRKIVLYTSMFIFTVGSLLCGAAQTITWLILARALTGIGGGGIVSSVWTITSEIVPVTWASSAVAGPLLGGMFSNGNIGIFNWKWCFYLNLPICLVAFIVLSISLRNVNLSRSDDASWKKLYQKFDFGGLFAFMSGTGLVIIGFSFASQKGWAASSTLCLILFGLGLLTLGAFYELRTQRDALFPSLLFKDMSCAVILIVVFLHSFTFTVGTFYIALYFQAVDGMSPFEAGLASLPYSLGSSLVSMPAAWFVGFWQKRRGDMSGQKWISFLGLTIGTLGFGLMTLLNEKSSRVVRILYPMVSGLGLGLLLHAPYQVFTRALQSREIASGTSAFFLVRFTGATVGLSIAGAIFNMTLNRGLPSGYNYTPGSHIDIMFFHLLEPLTLRNQVMYAVAHSVQLVWTVCCPCLGFATLASLFMKSVVEDPSEATAPTTVLGPASPSANAVERPSV